MTIEEVVRCTDHWWAVGAALERAARKRSAMAPRSPRAPFLETGHGSQSDCRHDIDVLLQLNAYSGPGWAPSAWLYQWLSRESNR